MSDLARRAKEVFLDALDREQGEREAFLLRACGDDAALLARVRSLLAAHLESQADDAGHVPTPQGVFEAALEAGRRSMQTLDVGDRVADYELERVLGEGGFGTVYLAKQEQPVRRRVALKVLKLGMDTRAVVARFEAEREALARMDHPGIARVLDAGATEDGRPFFAMEVVDGAPITTYCAERSLRRRARLELFREVCSALQHAHQKGLIHRDIKPSNVLVTTIDGRPAPKIIDFGIAKILQADDPDRSAFTREGQLIGTPIYMSPEQAGAESDVDTRSDVYSLGVLLYELLTGAPPFDPRELHAAALDELRRLIREVDPPRPSARTKTQLRSGNTTTAVPVVADLDWIVMRCLEKDRDRRYPTAFALAGDIDRFLDGLPVDAAPPSAVYRIRKLLRRHRLAATAGAVLVVGVLAGLFGATWGLLEAGRANEALTEAADELRVQRAEAVTEAKRARAFSTFLRDDLLGAAAPSGSAQAGPDVRLVDALDAASRRIALATGRDGTLDGEYEVQADLHLTLGEVYNKLGRWDDARRHLESTLALHDGAVEALPWDGLKTRQLLAASHLREGDLATAEDLLASLEVDVNDQLGPEAELSIQVLSNIATLAQLRGDYARCLELNSIARERAAEHLGVQDLLTLNLTSQLAITLDVLGRPDEAEPHFREALAGWLAAVGPDGPETLLAQLNLASFLQIGRDLDEADALIVDALERAARVLGEPHPDHVRGRHLLASVRRQQERLDEAEELCRGAFDDAQAREGKLSTSAVRIGRTLGMILSDQGRADEADELWSGLLDTADAAGRGDTSTIASLAKDLGNLLYGMGRHEEALELYARSLAFESSHYGDEHPATLGSYYSVAVISGSLGQTERAYEAYAVVHEHGHKVWGGAGTYVLNSSQRLAQGHLIEGRPDDAATVLDEAIERAAGALAEADPRLLALRIDRVQCDLQRGDDARAEAQLLEVFEGLDGVVPDDHRDRVRTALMLSEVVAKSGDQATSDAWRRVPEGGQPPGR